MLNKIAIIAGSGRLPIDVALYLNKIKVNFIVLKIKNFAVSEEYKKFNSYSLRMGQGYKAIQILKENKIKKIIFLGALKRPTLIDLKPDFWTLIKVFKFIFFKKTDDVILRNVVSIFENEGFKVIGLSKITKKFFLKKGVYGIRKIPKKDRILIDKMIIETIKWTKKDLGQCVITSKNKIILKENRRGTNNLLMRLNKINNKNSYLFIKIKKLHQDNRVDLPTIGINTIKNLVKTSIKYIILNANYTIVFDKKKIFNYLKQHNKILISVDIVKNNNKKYEIKI